jgi:peptidylprolyl isomerase
MPLEQASLVYVNYTAKVKDTGEAIESTLEETAKKLGIHDPEKRYEPKLISVGEGWVLSGLDEEIKKMDVAEKKTVELLPKKAFGERDPTKLRMVPLRKFGEKASELSAGDQVEIDNRVATVKFIGSGRVQVDFNHRLAGKTLIYEVEVLRKLDTDDEKLKGLILRRFPGEGEKLKFSMKDSSVEIEISEEDFLVEGLQIIKRGIANDVFHFLPSIEIVTFAEKYASKKPKAEEKPKEEQAPEQEVKQQVEATAEAKS